MKNNVYDEKSMGDKLKDFHSDIVEKIDLPDWVKKLLCPHCCQKLTPDGIRSISLCLNARNFCDISVSYHCHKCCLMDTVFYRNAVESLEDFCKCVKNEKNLESRPVVEEEMYKLRYNNLVEMFLKENSHGND